jgi:hypothetical protein
LNNFILKTLKFPANKRGTFDVNLVFTATLACTNRGTFHHKKGHFWSFEKIWEGARAPCAPPVPTPMYTLLIQAGQGPRQEL